MAYYVFRRPSLIQIRRRRVKRLVKPAANLTATLSIQTRMRGSPVGIVPLVNRTAIQGKAFAVPSGNVPLAGRLATQFKSLATTSGVVGMIGRIVTQAKASLGAYVGKVPLFGVLATQGRALAKSSGAVPLLARVATQSKSPASLFVFMALVARVTTAAKASLASYIGVVPLRAVLAAQAKASLASYIGKVPLFGILAAQAKALATSRGVVPITAQVKARVAGLALFSGRVPLAAVLAAQAKALATSRGVVPLLARVASQIKSANTLSTGAVLQALLGTLTSQVKARGAMTGVVPLLGRIANQFKARSRLVFSLARYFGAQPTSGISALAGGAIAQLPPIKMVILLGRLTAQFRERASPAGIVGLSARAATQFKSANTLSAGAVLQALFARAGMQFKALGKITGVVPLTYGIAGINDARSFDGISDYIDVPYRPPSTSSFSVALWVNYVNATSGDQGRVFTTGQYNAAGGIELYFGTDNTGGNIAIGSGSTTATAGNFTTPIGTWSQLTATYDGSSLKFFGNGVQSGSTTSTSLVVAHVAQDIAIGRNLAYSVPGALFPGYITEVALWNIALTGTQIANLAAGKRADTIGANANLLNYLPILGQSPEPDKSGNGNNGTLNGTAVVAGPPSLQPYGGTGAPGLTRFYARGAVSVAAGLQAVLGTLTTQVKASGQLSGVVPLLGRVATQVKASAPIQAISNLVAVLGRMGSQVKVFGGLSGVTRLSGRLTAAAGVRSVSGLIIRLAATVNAQAKALGAVTGRAAMAARAMASAATQAGWSGRVGLAGRVAAAVTAQGRAVPTIFLAGLMKAQAGARSTAAYTAHLTAIATAQAKASAQAVGIVPLRARVATAAQISGIETVTRYLVGRITTAARGVGSFARTANLTGRIVSTFRLKFIYTPIQGLPGFVLLRDFLSAMVGLSDRAGSANPSDRASAAGGSDAANKAGESDAAGGTVGESDAL